MCSYKGLFIPLLLAKRLGDSLRSHSLHDNMPLLQLQNTYSKQMLLFQNSGLEESTQYEHSFNMFLRQLDGYKQNKQAFYARLCE